MLAAVSASDHLIDLGCGDGRVVIEAARRYGARGVGVDFEPYWVDEARRNAATAGVAHLAHFEQHDAVTFDLSPATVVFMYLVERSTSMLGPIIDRQVARGTRVVSHNYPVDGWVPERTEQVIDDSGAKRTLYLWVR